jgi:hypothetical protein
MYELLNFYTIIAVVVFAVGLSLHLGRWFKVLLLNRRYKGTTKDFEGGPDKISFIQGVRSVLFDPVKNFYKKANPTWNRGYMFYHVAIITKSIGYALATLIVLPAMLLGNPIPNVATHEELSYNYAPGNVAAIVFGSGEPLQANFLFGAFADAFMLITGIALAFAVFGNLHMVYTVLRKRGAAAILHDIDEAAKDIRSNGKLKWDRIAVRFIIFSIIWVDILSRLHMVENIVFVHAALGVTLLMLFPFSYLFHMVYNVLALYYSARRRMTRTVA